MVFVFLGVALDSAETPFANTPLFLVLEALEVSFLIFQDRGKLFWPRYRHSPGKGALLDFLLGNRHNLLELF